MSKNNPKNEKMNIEFVSIWEKTSKFILRILKKRAKKDEQINKWENDENTLFLQKGQLSIFYDCKNTS